MKDIDQAYRILDLQPGATLRQVAAARDELKTLWDPDRLARHASLHAKAPGKIKEIQQAYEVLVNHLGRTDSLRSLPPPAAAVTVASPHPRAPEQPPASLFEEVFSEEDARGANHEKRRLPIWFPVISIMVLGILVVYFIASSSPPQDQPDPSPLRNPQTLTSPDRPSDPKPHPSVSKQEATGQVRAEGMDPISPDPQPVVPVSAKQSAQTASTGRPMPASSSASGRQSGLELKGEGKRRSASSNRRGPRPVLIRSPAQASQPSANSKDTAHPEKKHIEPLQEDREAYRHLLQQSSTARRLAEGKLKEVRLVEWRVVQKTPAEIWVDLVGRTTAGEPTHYIWSISRKDGVIQALSPAARRLEKNYRLR